MSKVPYTINVDEYICTELETFRKMTDTLDFSQMSAIIERIQFHANSMERALYHQKDQFFFIQKWLDDEKLSDAECREKIKEVMEKNK